MAGSGIGGFGSGTPAMNGARGSMLDVELEGVRKLQARFKVAGAGMAMKMGDVCYQVAQDIAETARALVAVDTGRTQKNIKARKGKFEAEVVATRGGERDEVPAYLELGTHKMAARPFLKPAGEMAMAAGGVYKSVREVGGLLTSTRI